jgi:AraC-like DNA-binding protein
MDKSGFLWYTLTVIQKGRGKMHSYFAKTTNNSDSVSTRYISVNNFGYYENHSDMRVCRKGGRLDFQLIYVKRGNIVIHDRDGDFNLSEGGICLFRPGEPQVYSIFNQPTTFYWIHFSGTEVAEMLSFFQKRAYFIGSFPEFESYCRGFWLEFQSNRRSVELFYEGKLITLIAEISEGIGKDEKKSGELLKLRPALKIMKSECHIRRTNQELAELCGINKYYFMKLFKKNTGISPQAYYAKLIIDKSVQLLLNTDCSISEISKLCGIDDAFYFSRMFKKQMGVSPQAYRREIFGL